ESLGQPVTERLGLLDGHGYRRVQGVSRREDDAGDLPVLDLEEAVVQLSSTLDPDLSAARERGHALQVAHGGRPARHALRGPHQIHLARAMTVPTSVRTMTAPRSAAARRATPLVMAVVF